MSDLFFIYTVNVRVLINCCWRMLKVPPPPSIPSHRSFVRFRLHCARLYCQNSTCCYFATTKHQTIKDLASGVSPWKGTYKVSCILLSLLLLLATNTWFSTIKTSPIFIRHNSSGLVQFFNCLVSILSNNCYASSHTALLWKGSDGLAFKILG